MQIDLTPKPIDVSLIGGPFDGQSVRFYPEVHLPGEEWFQEQVIPDADDSIWCGGAEYVLLTLMGRIGEEPDPWHAVDQAYVYEPLLRSPKLAWRITHLDSDQ